MAAGQVAHAEGAAPTALEASPPPAPVERAAIAAKLYHAVVAYFAHGEALPPGNDFEATFRAFLDEAFAARTRLDFTKAAMRCLATLRNGHTSFVDDRLSAEPDLPFRAERIDGRWIVVRSHLAAGVLDPGDEIATIDGRPLDAWVAENVVFVRRSNERASETALFATAFLWPSHFTLGLGGGRTVAIDRTVRATGAWRGAPTPEALTVTAPRPGVVQMAIPQFGTPAFEDGAIAAIRQHQAVRTLIIDVRGNEGGNTPEHLLAALIEAPYREMIDATPLHVGTLDTWAAAGEPWLVNAMVRSGGDWVQPDHPIFHGRVLVLVDRRCVSSCEDFVLGMRLSHRATIIGETTAGSTGQPFIVAFPQDGMWLRVSTRREYFPDFRGFEGVGVTPDVAVALTAGDLRAGRDAVLDRALALAK